MIEKRDFIKVATIFKEGKIIPVWFEWNKFRYPVDKILYRWDERKGGAQILYFSVLSSDEHYNIAFDSENFVWYIINQR